MEAMSSSPEFQISASSSPRSNEAGGRHHHRQTEKAGTEAAALAGIGQESRKKTLPGDRSRPAKHRDPKKPTRNRPSEKKRNERGRSGERRG